MTEAKKATGRTDATAAPLRLSDAGQQATHSVSAIDERGEARTLMVAGERPLTLYVDKQEVVTLMTLGTHPEWLVLGYLYNQGLIEQLGEVQAVQVDWEVEAAAVVTRDGISNLADKLSHRTVTSGCGQGTVFGTLLDSVAEVALRPQPLRQSRLYGLLDNLRTYNEIYRSAGAVHGCALCQDTEVIGFVEDVGRHNAVDALAGKMLLEGIDGMDKLFYTTGRLTSEMVIKVARMGIPTLLSRSGVTQMGYELAQRLGLTLIGRAKGRHFLVFNGKEQLVFDSAD